jgi:hypothetical protein
MKRHYLQIIYRETLIKYRKFHKRLTKKISNGSFQQLTPLKRKTLVALVESLRKRLENLQPRLAALAAAGLISLSFAFTDLAAQPFVLQSNPNTFGSFSTSNNVAPDLVDIDNDGDQDAFIGNVNGVILYYENTGSVTNPIYTNRTGTSNPLDAVSVGWSDPAFVDIDNDGDKDVFIGETYGHVLYYENTGTASVPSFTLVIGTSNAFDGVDVSYTPSLSFADIDNDGDMDAVMGEYYGTGLLYFENTGTASAAVFTQQSGTSNPFDGINTGNHQTPTLIDFDSDGDQDLVLGRSAGDVAYYENTGTVSASVFTAKTGTANPFGGIGVANNSSVALGDIDNDADMDLFVGTGNGLILFYQNDKNAPEINITESSTSIADGGSATLPDVVVSSSGTPVTFTIENTGSTTLNISGITLSGTDAAEFALGSIPTSVSAGSTGSFTVTFSPTSGGAKTATIDIASNDTDEGSYQVNISATGTAPEINILQGVTSIADGGSTTLPNVAVSSSGSPVTFTIENTGNLVLNISGITLTGTDAADFALGSIPTSVSAGSTGSFTVTFSPTGAGGTEIATINIASDDADEGSYQVDISATATVPEINIKNGSTSISDGGSTTLPNVAVSSSGSPVTFTIENTGDAVLNISGITLTGTDAADFAFGSIPTSVSAGSTGSFTVTFSPTGAGGTEIATINIASDDADEGSYQVDISATATVPEINIKNGSTSIADGGSTTLPNVAVSSSGTPVTFTIENTGNAILNISGITLSGTNAADFVLGSIPTSVAAGSTGSFTVTFSPTGVAGAKIATINIASNDADEGSYQVNISSNATAVTTAINNVQANISSYKLYPNPSTERVTVELELKSESDVKIALSDMMGREVITIAQGTMSSLKADFHVGSLSKGAYIITYLINGIPAKSELLMVK